MLILHITPTDARYDSRILKEVSSLNKLKLYNIVVFGVEDNEGQLYSPENNFDIHTFKIYSSRLFFLPRAVRYFLKFFEALIKISYRGIQLNPKIIHCHDTLFLPIAVIIKYFSRSKLIYDAHELESDKAGQSYILSKFSLLIEKACWHYLDSFITVSPSILEWYQNKFSLIKSEIILNSPILAPNKSNITSNENYLKHKFSIPKDHIVFLYLGILSNNGRSLKLLIDTFKDIQYNFHIVFVGYGDFVNELKNLSYLHSNIHLHESVRHDEVVSLSKSADVGICLIEPISLSDYFSLPNKLFEYAFSGLFILASDLPDIRVVVEKYNLGMCSKTDFKSFSETLNDISKKMTVKPVLSYEKLYDLSWECQEKKLTNLYLNLIKN